MAHLLPLPKIRFFDSNGDPLAGGKLFSYAAGTSTLQATYIDNTGTTTNTNPVVLDANGEASVFIGSSAYKFVLKDANDNVQWTQDGVAHVQDLSIQTGMLANGILAANPTGLSKMADGFLSADALGRAKMASGYIDSSKLSATLRSTVGDIKMHHTFGGAAPVERGWMICNGAQISQTNYDALHGSGAFNTDNISTSPIFMKYTPDLVSKYAVGASTTPATGDSAIPSVGTVGHTLNLEHTHGIATGTHQHTWYDSITGAADRSWEGAGGANQAIGSGFLATKSLKAYPHLRVFLDANAISGVSTAAMPTAKVSAASSGSTADPSLSASQSIQPESIPVLYLVKVV